MSDETSSTGAASEAVTSALVATLGPVLSAPLVVSGVQRLSGGASRETWAFKVEPSGAPETPMILRRDPEGRPGLDGSMRREADAMRACGRAGLRVPQVIAQDDGPLLGTAGLVMSMVPGETLARRILRDQEFAHARTVLTAHIGEFFAGLHRIDPAEVPGLEEPDPLAVNLERYQLFDEVSPTIEAAFRWLAANRPPSAGRVIVHGDLRLGNIIVDAEGLRAAIDWELVHLGDPLEDLAWLCVKCWRFGSPLEAAGVGTIDELISAYEAAGGDAVDRAAFHWWLVLNTLKWGIGCMGQAAAHLTGMVRSVELAAIGRRVAEQEWDLLGLLAPQAAHAALAAAASLPEPPAGDPGLFGRPTAEELVEAAREFLSEEVMGATTGRISFHVRVTANVLATVERQLRHGAAQEQRWEAGLASLGVSSISELSDAIGSGTFDDRMDDLYTVLAGGVHDKLAVYNPKYLAYKI